MTGHRRKITVFLGAALIAATLTLSGSGPAERAAPSRSSARATTACRPATSAARTRRSTASSRPWPGRTAPDKSTGIMALQGISEIGAGVSASPSTPSVGPRTGRHHVHGGHRVRRQRRPPHRFDGPQRHPVRAHPRVGRHRRTAPGHAPRCHHPASRPRATRPSRSPAPSTSPRRSPARRPGTSPPPSSASPSASPVAPPSR